MMTSLARILTGLGGGILFVLVYAHYDPWIHAQATHLFLRAFEKGLSCKARGTVCSVNILKPEMVLENLVVEPINPAEAGAWHWRAQRYTTGFSWWNFLTTGSIDMTVALDGFEVRTQMNENRECAITPHLEALIAGPDFDIPLYLKALTLHRASCTFVDTSQTVIAHAAWNSEAKKMQNHVRAMLYLTDGCIKHDRYGGEQLSGSVTIDASDAGDGLRLAASFDLQARWNPFAHELCCLTGSWQNDQGSITVYSHDRSFIISPCQLIYRDGDLSFDAMAHVPVQLALHCADLASIAPSLEGSLTTHVYGSLKNQIVEGSLAGSLTVLAAQVLLPQQKISFESNFTKQGSQVDADVELSRASYVRLAGTVHWNEQTSDGSLVLRNTHPVTLDVPGLFVKPFGWQIERDALSLSWKHDVDGIDFSCSGVAGHAADDQQVPFAGTGHYEKATRKIDYVMDCNAHHAVMNGTTTYPFLTHASYAHDGKDLFTINHREYNSFTSSTDLSCLRALLAQCYGYDMQGEGALHLDLALDGSRVVADMHLTDATVRLAHTYNFINALTAHVAWDYGTRTCLIRDLACGLHTGMIRTKRACIIMDSDSTINFAHVPLWLDRCLLNSDKNLFAITSANLLLSKPQAQGYTLMGHVILDRAQLKENIFSDAFQKTILHATQSLSHAPSFDMACNIFVETKDPVRVDTDFLKANAQVNLHVTNTITNPSLHGTIILPSGSLKFPYKPLEIQNARIQFVTDQPLNPHIELLAKNSIKNHRISLQVTGSVQEHMVTLDSTPPLTQEQIVGLLLAGSHDESLRALVPALLMQNITNLVFTDQKAGLMGVWDRYVKPWIKQFNVNFVPRLSDQTGRGGLRGILEMSVNDRWRALIEKNFSLTEDTRFELEYLLSDDVTFRLIRDERYDIGGEVEVRWKF